MLFFFARIRNFSYICNTYNGIPPPKIRGGDFCVLNQLVMIKTTYQTYILPELCEFIIPVEVGFVATLEDPAIDSEHEW